MINIKPSLVLWRERVSEKYLEDNPGSSEFELGELAYILMEVEVKDVVAEGDKIKIPPEFLTHYYYHEFNEKGEVYVDPKGRQLPYRSDNLIGLDLIKGENHQVWMPIILTKFEKPGVLHFRHNPEYWIKVSSVNQRVYEIE